MTGHAALIGHRKSDRSFAHVDPLVTNRDPGSLPPPPSDEALAQRFSAGDRAAFDDLVERYQDLMFQVATWHGGREQAEDLAQEIFVRLFHSIPSFAGRSSFRTWMIGLARNVCRQQLRKQRRRLGTVESRSETFSEIPDRRLDSLERLERRERLAWVRAAVTALPEHHRSALVLREWHGLSYREISLALQVPVGTVRSRIHNARTTLANFLDPQSPERPDHAL